MQAMEIGRSALAVEWRRIEVIAENLANLNSVGDGRTPLYRERQLLSGPQASFSSYLNGEPPDNVTPAYLRGVDIRGVVESDAPPRLVHEPGNPLADTNGMVAYPNVDHTAQMLEMIKASRAYEANIVSINAARQMYARALDLGRRS